MMAGYTRAAGIAASAFAALLCGAVFIGATGADPLEVYLRMFSDSFGSSYGIGQILFKSTTLIFTGLSAAICFRAGLFNIGAEGQLMSGALLIALVASVSGAVPPVFALPISLLAGALGGALWGYVPGILKSRFGAHEVINTIMMNYVAAALIGYLINILAVPATVHTAPIPEGGRLPRLDVLTGMFQGSPANASFLLALLTCVIVWHIFRRSGWGYEVRAVGLNPLAARYAGIDVSARQLTAMVLSGACAGLGGSNFVLGYKYYYEVGFSENAGFIGIAVALLSDNHPIGIIFASLFFAFLEYGGLTINTLVPKELVTILQALMIILVVVFSRLFQSWYASRDARLATEAAHG